MVTASDAPYLDCAYKLQEYAGQARRKTSEGKATWPGRKQAYRRLRRDCMRQDIVALEGEAVEGQPLLRLCMQAGKPVAPFPSLAGIREYAGQQLDQLPASLQQLEAAPAYPVRISRHLQELAASLDAHIA